MSHLIIGDGHYCGADGEKERFGTLIEAALSRRVREISVLGDFFELWLALPGAMMAWQDELLEPLRHAKAAGVVLRYLIGNKDYFVADWNAGEKLFSEVSDTHIDRRDAHHRLRLAHGDLVNLDDRQYQSWRKFSRSAPLQLLAKSFPGRLTWHLGNRLGRHLETTNKEHKSYFPENHLRARAREVAGEIDLMVYGHFHQHRDLVESGVRIITLPFLATENAGLWIEEDRIELFAA